MNGKFIVVKSPSPIANFVKVSKQNGKIRFDFVDTDFNTVMTLYSTLYRRTPLNRLNKEFVKGHEYFTKLEYVLEGLL